MTEYLAIGVNGDVHEMNDTEPFPRRINAFPQETVTADPFSGIADQERAALQRFDLHRDKAALNRELAALISERRRLEKIEEALDAGRAYALCAKIAEDHNSPAAQKVLGKLTVRMGERKNEGNQKNSEPEGTEGGSNREKDVRDMLRQNDTLQQNARNDLWNGEDIDAFNKRMERLIEEQRALEMYLDREVQQRFKPRIAVEKDRQLLEKLIGRDSTPRFNDRERAVLEAYQWNYSDHDLQDRLGRLLKERAKHEDNVNVLGMLVTDFGDPGTLSRISHDLGTISEASQRDVLICSVGANLAMPATYALLSVLGGPEFARAYAAIELTLTAIPGVPGVPGFFRWGAFAIGRGAIDAVDKYRRLKDRGRPASLPKLIGQSIAVGIPAGFDLGYLFVPIVTLYRRLDVDITFDAMMAIARRGAPLYKLFRKYDALDLLEEYAELV